MDWKILQAKNSLKGEVVVPADKSISHRAIMFGSIARGDMRISNFLFGEDCISTLDAFKALGVEILKEGDTLLVKGRGLKGLVPPKGPIYLGNSGTSMRIISGILAAQSFTTTLTGDESLSKRPMKRIIEPLEKMGARIESTEGHAPLKVTGSTRPIKAIKYLTPVASAQVKSCILAAGLYADGKTIVIEPFQSRDHTERMLEYFSADIKKDGLTTEITGQKELEAKDVEVPGDVSSAAFFVAAALLVEGSSIVLRNVGLNRTRIGVLNVLERMGGKIEASNLRGELEPMGDLEVVYSPLKGTVVEEEEIPLLIDEIPVLMVAACLAEGETIIKGISELKVKESDRVKTMIDNLSRMGCKIKEKDNSLIIYGGEKTLKCAELDSFTDHRIAMSMAIAALVSNGECLIKNVACVDTSYPGFYNDLEKVSGK